MLRTRNGLLALSAAALLVPACARAQGAQEAQDRTVVSKEVSVGKSEAMLRLEFAEGKPLEIALRDGSVVIDGQTVGTYQPADPLDTAWRSLLGGAVSLDDGALAAMLRGWVPPDGLQGDDESLAQSIENALHGALVKPAQNEKKAEPNLSLSTGKGNQAAVLRALLSQADRLGALEQALKGVGENIQLHVDEDVSVDPGQTVDGTLVVIQGNAHVAGTVDGDVVVVGGSLDLADGGRVTGDVRLADSHIQRDGGTVEGEVVNVSADQNAIDSATRTRIRSEVRKELRSEMRNQLRNVTRANRAHSNPVGSFLAPFRGVFSAVGGLIEDVVTIFVLSLIGMGVLAFGGDKLDIVAETARQAPGRSAMVGIAGTFLLLPVYILGIVALAVSIVGIPVMIAWLPLFPLAAVAAAILGYLAVARNVGAWLADSDYRYTGWIRRSNPVYLIVGGLVGLGTFFMAAHVLAMVPFFGFVRGLLRFVGVMFGLVALQIGFGAVLLTRGGRRRGSYPGTYDAEWESAVDVDVDLDGATATASAPAGPGDAGTGADADDTGTPEAPGNPGADSTPRGGEGGQDA